MLHTTPAQKMVLDFRKVNGPINMMSSRQKRRLKKLIVESQKTRDDMAENHVTWMSVGRKGAHGNFRHRVVNCSRCGVLGTADSRREANMLEIGHERLMNSIGEPIGED